MPPDQWLDKATAGDLETLARCLREGRIKDPASRAAVQLAGFNREVADFLGQFAGGSTSTIAWALERLAKERRKAEARFVQAAKLVWSGQARDTGALRDTKVVLEELFAKAESHVLLTSYVIYDGKQLFKPLAERLKERPELRVELYVNLFSDTGKLQDEPQEVEAYVARFRKQNWPEGLELPRIYYDPETRKLGKERVSLHAKCVVVDKKWVLITSANLTEAAQERNTEVGVLLEHPKIAEALVARFEGLRESGVYRRMWGGIE